MIVKLRGAGMWKKAVLLLTGVAVAGISGVCFGIRFIPELVAQGELTAMTAAGFIVPAGAAQILKGNADTEHMTKEEAVSAVSETASGVLSSSAGPSSTPLSQASSSGATDKKWTGKAYPVEEVTITQGNTESNGIVVRNLTKNHKLDIAKVLGEQPDISLKKDGSVEVLIYHTHSSEAYLAQESATYYSDMPTRSQKEEENVMAVGEEIANELRKAGIGVVHDKTYHDYPAYNGSYTRSAETIQKNLKEYPGIQITLDIHRDAISGSSGERRKPTAVVNGKKAAQVMLLCGCDDDGSLGHPDWEYNLRLGMRIQQECEKIEGDFMRPMTFSATKYNQNLTHGSLLVEFGTEVNTIDEAKYSGQLFGEALGKVLQGL